MILSEFGNSNGSVILFVTNKGQNPYVGISDFTSEVKFHFEDRVNVSYLISQQLETTGKK